MDLGVDGVIRETFAGSLELSEKVMTALGIAPDVARERSQRFREHDHRLLQEQHLVYDDEAALVASSKEALRELQGLFEADEAREQ